jgi:DNA-binding NarL/FixJ family response regulator
MRIECPYRVVLADDHAAFRHDLKRVLREKGDLEVVGEVGDGIELLEFLNFIESAPQMAIIDLSMPNLGGIEATSKIKNTYPDMKILILSMHREKEYVRGALSAGADGYVLKREASAELFSAIEKIRQGGIYISLLLTKVDNF